jgi:hypothetical protein
VSLLDSGGRSAGKTAFRKRDSRARPTFAQKYGVKQAFRSASEKGDESDAQGFEGASFEAPPVPSATTEDACRSFSFFFISKF